MFVFKTKKYKDQLPRGQHCLLGVDIGGTNSNFGIFSCDDAKPELLVSLHIKSREVKEFSSFFLYVLSYISKQYHLMVTNACIGAAGVISEDGKSVKPTNLSFVIDIHKLEQASNLEIILLINDFEAVGYGIALLHPDNLVVAHEGEQRAYANKAILGAGTGLGKAIMHWHEIHNAYIPLPSEGGHADFAAQSQQDLDLITFIKEQDKGSDAVSWEDVLSGRGIQRIYRFLKASGTYQETQYTTEIEKNGAHPDAIFNRWQGDPLCQDTYKLFARYYGRCAKCLTLDALALSGLYIAGGIAEKNRPLFQLPVFLNEFFNCGKQQKLLKETPVFILADYNVSLLGAAQYLVLYIQEHETS